MSRHLIAFLRDRLTQPDGHETDALAHAHNQMWHVALGCALAWLLGPEWAAAVWACWEIVQWRMFGATPQDMAEDLGFNLAGVSIAALSVAWAWGALAALFLAGVIRRAGR